VPAKSNRNFKASNDKCQRPNGTFNTSLIKNK